MNSVTIRHAPIAAAKLAAAAGALALLSAVPGHLRAATDTYAASFVLVDPVAGTVEIDGFGRVISSGAAAMGFAALAAAREPFFDTWQIDTSAIPAGPYEFTALTVEAAGSLQFTSVTFNSIDEAGVRNTILFDLNAAGTAAIGNGSFTVRASCPIESCVWIDIAGSQLAGTAGEGYGGTFDAVLVPEPASALLLAGGLAWLAGIARRRQRPVRPAG